MVSQPGGTDFAQSCQMYFFNSFSQILTKCSSRALLSIFETFDLIDQFSCSNLPVQDVCHPCQVSVVWDSQFSSLIWVDHVKNTCSKVPSTSCEQEFLLVLPGLGISQEVRHRGHVVSAADLMLFILVLTSYNKFSFALVFKIPEEEGHIFHLITANPLKNAELSVEEICCFIDRVLMLINISSLGVV